MIRRLKELTAWLKAARPPEPPRDRIIQTGAGGAGSAASLKIAKCVTPAAGCYGGKLVDRETGEETVSIQFRFPNDPGVEALLGQGDYVLVQKCPAFDEDNEAWDGSAPKYWAILSPWAAFRLDAEE